MLFERIISEGLAHYSYLIGDGNEAVVIDPRRDCSVYAEMACNEGMKISSILETHRNEDYVIGSLELQARTGAEIWHADSQWDYKYGKPVSDGQRWKVGRLELQALLTPGHTPGMMSYILKDPSGLPWVVFTGDALFAGEVGRVDILGMDKAPEMAGILYHSIFDRLLPLGDGVIVCPAHGAGSVCGEAIAERVWTTIGMERLTNPRLQHREKAEFIEDLLKNQPEKPPYFEKIERFNQEGAPLLGPLPAPKPIAPKEFEALYSDSFILDIRKETSFASAHVAGSQSIWLEGLASFEGWFLPYDLPVLIVSEGECPKEAVMILIREGFDNIAGYLAGGMLRWHMAGLRSTSIGTITVHDICQRLDSGEELNILDVRSDEELARGGRIPRAQHIHVTQIPKRAMEMPKKEPLFIFCGSGLRSMIAASYLQCLGWRELTVVLGGMSGWKSIRCPIQR